MGVLKSVAVGDILARGIILDSDVLRMRAAFYEDGLISRDEAETLLDLNRRCASEGHVWPRFYVEALTDYVVNQADPEGYVTATNAGWLIREVAPDGRIESKAEFDLILNVLDRARWSPESLSRFALEQVRRAVIEGDGPLRDAETSGKGLILDSEVDLIRRVLYAFAGDGSIAVTRAEAEILFDIEDAIQDRGASPAWVDLYSKAVANVILAASGYAPPSREEALRADAWLARRGELAPATFLKAAVTSSISMVWEGYQSQSTEARALARLERQRIEIITNEEISDTEAGWLAARLMRDGRVSPTERALLDYLAAEAPALHPELELLIKSSGRAA